MSLLASKLPKYLRQLAAVYEKSRDTYKRDVIRQGKWFLRPNTHLAGYDGEMEGHTVVLFAPLETVATIKPSKQSEAARQINSDLAELNSVSNEFIGSVVIEADDESDPECQAATGFAQRPPIDPDSVTIWKPGLARVFLSHRDNEKVRVQELADALEGYGMSCFVAHETIPADEDWQKVIVSGLETMELMIAIITDDFHESVYCMQEVGYALGRAIPVISLKVGKCHPLGFTSHKQAQKGWLDEPSKSAKSLFSLIGDRLRRLERLNDVLITSFCEAKDWHDARDRFERMKAHVEKLTAEQVMQIVSAYGSNDQLYNAIYLDNNANRLAKYMNKTTGGDWKIEGTKLFDQAALPDDDLDDDIPF